MCKRNHVTAGSRLKVIGLLMVCGVMSTLPAGAGERNRSDAIWIGPFDGLFLGGELTGADLLAHSGNIAEIAEDEVLEVGHGPGRRAPVVNHPDRAVGRHIVDVERAGQLGP